MKQPSCGAAFPLDSFMSKIISTKLASIAGLFALLALSGCATPPPADDPDAVAEFQQINDPLEPMNRDIFDFNEWLYDNGLTPAAKAYLRGAALRPRPRRRFPGQPQDAGHLHQRHLPGQRHPQRRHPAAL